MKYIIKLVLEVVFVFLFCVSSFAGTMQRCDLENDTTRFTIIVNGERVPLSYLDKHQDELEWIMGYPTAREALLYSGGKYKKGGLYFYRTLPAIPAEQLPLMKNVFRIKGNISHRFNGEYVKLFQLQGDSLLVDMDFAKVENGKFEFKGMENLNDYAILTVGEQPDVHSLELILERGDIKVDIGDSLTKVYGTPFNDLHYSLRDSVAQAWTAYNKACATKEDLAVKGKCYNDALSYTCSVMRKYMDTTVGKRFIEECKSSFPFSSDSLQSLHDDLEKIQENNPWITSAYVSRVRQQESLINMKYQEKKKIFIDFELNTSGDEKRRISDYVGKSEFLFIDFWASWCSPCVREIPGLRKLYKKYKDKGLEILSVSIDYNRKHWVSALAKYNMSWMQLATLEQGSDELQNAYGFKGIPYGILLNKDGEIVAVAGTWEILEKELVDLLPVDEIIK